MSDSSRRKVIVFIVEGLSDQTALENYLSAFLDDKLVRFYIYHGDITSDSRVNPGNIIAKISSIIRDRIINVYKIKASDIQQIVMITDLDGVYIADSDILYAPEQDTPFYGETCIQTDKVQDIVDRNILKRANLHQLLSKKFIMRNIPFRVYFMACNLDHVLHGKANATQDEKEEMAVEFSDRFDNNLAGFIDFISNSEFSCQSGYKESWNFIRQGRNSLGRFTNLNLFFSSEDDGYQQQ